MMDCMVPKPDMPKPPMKRRGMASQYQGVRAKAAIMQVKPRDA